MSKKFETANLELNFVIDLLGDKFPLFKGEDVDGYEQYWFTMKDLKSILNKIYDKEINKCDIIEEIDEDYIVYGKFNDVDVEPISKAFNNKLFISEDGFIQYLLFNKTEKARKYKKEFREIRKEIENLEIFFDKYIEKLKKIHHVRVSKIKE